MHINRGQHRARTNNSMQRTALRAAADAERWAVNMRFISIVLAAIFTAVPFHAACGDDAEVPQRGYSVAPLRNPIFEPAQVVVETTALNNWLAANIQKLSYEQMKGPREQLYYLIDSRIKQLYAEEERILPKAGDPILELLFSWSEYLGVFGGADVFNAVKASSAKAREPAMQVPPGISLRLSKDLFVVSSDLGWSVRFPYYFMIWNVADFTATGGQRTQLLMLSTGAARDKSQLGHSQATVMFMFSPGGGSEAFEAYWRKALAIEQDSRQVPLNIRDLKSYHVMDATLKLHKEFTTWSSTSGSYAVAYLGIEGTYEWNRPHFLDFLRSIETSEQSQPNNALRLTPEDGRG